MIMAPAAAGLITSRIRANQVSASLAISRGLEIPKRHCLAAGCA